MKQITVSIPPECEGYANDIKRFVDAMVYKLKKNAHKGRWEGLTVDDILKKLVGEYQELHDAIYVEGGNTVETLLEAADVANFAMIIATMFIEGQNAKPV